MSAPIGCGSTPPGAGAALGVTSLRLDVEGIGDSDGDGELFGDVGYFHGAQFFEQTRTALDRLEEAGLGDRFVLVGLCSGAYWAFHAALADDRVAAALMINPRVIYWDEHLEIARELRRTRLLVKPVIWKRVLRGDVSFERWAAMARWFAAAPLRFVRRLRRARREPFSVAGRIAAAFDRVRERDLHARFLFCDGEPLFDELTRDGLLAQQEPLAHGQPCRDCPDAITPCARCGCTSMSSPRWMTPSTPSLRLRARP